MPEFCEVGYSTLVRAQGHNFKGYLHWGKVLAVEGSECTIKWQIAKKPSSHSITDVLLTAFHSIPSSDSASEAPLGAPQAQCARSATIWASGRTRDPYFEILGAPRGIMVTPSVRFDF